jgi:hypothetical protein
LVVRIKPKEQMDGRSSKPREGGDAQLGLEFIQKFVDVDRHVLSGDGFDNADEGVLHAGLQASEWVWGVRVVIGSETDEVGRKVHENLVSESEPVVLERVKVPDRIEEYKGTILRREVWGLDQEMGRKWKYLEKHLV